MHTDRFQHNVVARQADQIITQKMSAFSCVWPKKTRNICEERHFRKIKVSSLLIQG